MDAQVEDIKQFLYSWLGKQKKTPNYDVTQVNSKVGKTRFKCEVRAEGYAYTGVGNSTSKKDAQSNAALDFCQFLVRGGMVNQNDLPAMAPPEGSGGASFNSLPKGIVAPHQSLGLNFNEGMWFLNKF